MKTYLHGSNNEKRFICDHKWNPGSEDNMKKLILILSLTFSFTAFAETGILFIAHGTMNMSDDHGDHKSMDCSSVNPSKWESYILSTINGMKSEIPQDFEISFGMWESHCFEGSINKLSARIANKGGRLDHLIVFPLFISSYSSVIEMQKYIFKKRPDKILDIPHVHQTKFIGKITYMPAFDYTPQISLILANRFHQLVHMAQKKQFSNKNMELILVMHGPVEDDANKLWIKMGQQYNRDITYLFPVSNSHVISLRDDASDEVKEEATKALREITQKATSSGKIALILPLLISKGGIDGGIVERLKGLDYIWTGESLFPDTKLKDVILHKLNAEIVL